MKKHAFTLIEFLVVLALVVVLGSLFILALGAFQQAGNPTPTPAPMPAPLIEASYLPKDAKILEDLGNDWCVVEFKADGAVRKFIIKNMRTHGFYIQTITELQQR